MTLKKSLILFLMLVLNLLVLGWVHPSLVQETKAMKFRRQHFDPKTPSNSDFTYCDEMMVNRNITKGFCKKINTFVHAPWEKVEAVCLENLTLCKDGKMECHWSKFPMKLTNCVRKVCPRYPNCKSCKYYTNQTVGYISVVCEGKPNVPIHFDSFKLMSEKEDAPPPNCHGFPFPLFRGK